MDLNYLDDFFTNKPSPPFSQTATFHNYTDLKNDEEFIFETIANIFLYGITIKQQNSEFPLDINKTSMVQLNLIAEYMLSFGIVTNVKLVNKIDLNYSHRLFADELSLYFMVFVTQNWTLNNIEYVKVKSNNKKDIDNKKLQEICKKHKISNYFFNVYKPAKLKDFIKCFQVTDDLILTLSFEFGMLGEYQMFNRCY